MTAKELADQLITRFGEGVALLPEFRGETTLTVKDAEQIAEVCGFAKKEMGFDYLVDLSSVDHYGDDPRFDLVYELYGYGHRCHLRLKTSVTEEKAELPTVSGVWRTADWHEREIYDLMGIRFRGHPDLRRIIMWEGYPHHPLRKDFPVAGKPTEMPGVAFTEAAPIEGGPFCDAAKLQKRHQTRAACADAGGLPSMKTLDEQLLATATQRLVTEFQPEQIWLYGSHAWGNPHEDSDVDLMVVVRESKESSVRRSQRAHRCLGGLRMPKDVIVPTRGQVERYKHLRASLFHQILSRGRKLYG